MPPMSARRTDRASRAISAAPEVLYAAQLDPAALVAWLPPAGAVLEVGSLDPRPGGRFRFTLTFAAGPGKSTENSDVVTGRYVALDPPNLVVQDVDFQSEDPAYSGTMRISWHFRPADGGTEVEIVAENVPPGISAEDHATGLASSLENLARYTET